MGKPIWQQIGVVRQPARIVGGAPPKESHLPADSPDDNRLLAALSGDEQDRFVSHSDWVTLVFGEVLARPREPVSHVYFPTAGFISLITSADERSELEVGLIGDEGMLGAPLLLGVNESPARAVVQGDGPALCLETEAFRRALELGPDLEPILRRYLHVLIVQLGQTAACTRFHRIEARLARWLLMTQDRAHADAFGITHEFLANMLGVRRVGITEAASALQRRGLISYRRGHVTVLNRDGLQAAACGCYARDRQTYARTMT